ncbi:MAG: hypothetical protein ACI80F_000912 [Natronomonas sp.]|uniref:hypothetical protein n=1 Tax=Natronomonas sp. TaxID=2184060 RepID=UPI0039893DDF
MPRREATIQGEVHTGDADKRRLLERGLEEHDAVLVEGRSPTLVIRELTLGYAGFLMGYVTLMWVQAVVGRLRRRVSGRVDLRDAAARVGVAYHDRIDADTATIYEMAPTTIRYLSGAWLFAILSLCLLVGVNRFVLVAYTLSMPYLYATLIIVLVKLAGKRRAAHMADRITDLAEERSYDQVSVLCGDAHREDISAALEQREWSVTTHGGHHLFGRLFGRS